jgi:hypothetical protein
MMPKGEFVRSCNELIKKYRGILQGKVVVDQVYAQNQHENLKFRHLDGGGPKFLTKALYQEMNKTMQGLARNFPQGDQRGAMAEGMERVVAGVRKNAPHEFNDLRNSGAPSVKERGRFVYKRAPIVPRLTKSQLKAKDRARGRRS